MDVVRYQTMGAVATITLDDHANRNALGSAMVAELGEAITRANADSDVRVIVLAHTGNVFCAGANLKERPATADEQHAWSRSFGALLSQVMHSPKPVVARIDGPALAGGMGLACAVDISVASDAAVFGLTEVRVGVAPAIVAVVCLPKMTIGTAKELMLRGNRIAATDAVRLGLVNHAVPTDQLDATVEAVVADLLLAGPNALTATKRLFSEVASRDETEAFEWAAQFSAELFISDEGREGMRAFAERRSPSWARNE